MIDNLRDFAEILGFVTSDPNFHRTSFILAFCLAGSGAAAIWSGVATGHWFLRGVAAWLAVATLVLIQASELFWIIAASVFFTVALASLAKWLHSKWRRRLGENERHRTSFRLADIFFAIALIGLCLAAAIPMARIYRPSSFWNWLVVSGALSAMWCCLGAAVFTSWRMPFRILLALVAPVPMLLVAAKMEWLHEVWPWYVNVPGHSWPTTEYLWCNAALQSYLMLLAGGVLVRVATSHRSDRRWRLACGFVLASSIFAAMIFIAALYVKLVALTPWREQHARKDEQVERIVAVAAEIAKLNPNWTTLPKPDSARGQTANAKRLRVLHEEAIELLSNLNLASEPFRQVDECAINKRDQFAHEARILSYFLVAEAKSHRSDNDFDASARNIIAVLQLGILLRRNEALSDLLAGDATIGLALEQLPLDIERMSDGMLNTALATLDSYSPHDDFDATIERTWLHEAHRGGWRGRMRYLLPEDNETENLLDDLIRHGEKHTPKRVQSVRAQILARMKNGI